MPNRKYANPAGRASNGWLRTRFTSRKETPFFSAGPHFEIQHQYTATTSYLEKVVGIGTGNLDRLQTLQTSKAATPSGVQSRTDVYDTIGNVTQRKDDRAARKIARK